MRRTLLMLQIVVLLMAAVAAAHADPADDFIRAEMKRQNIPGLVSNLKIHPDELG